MTLNLKVYSGPCRHQLEVQGSCCNPKPAPSTCRDSSGTLEWLLDSVEDLRLTPTTTKRPPGDHEETTKKPPQTKTTTKPASSPGDSNETACTTKMPRYCCAGFRGQKWSMNWKFPMNPALRSTGLHGSSVNDTMRGHIHTAPQPEPCIRECFFQARRAFRFLSSERKNSTVCKPNALKSPAFMADMMARIHV